MRERLRAGRAACGSDWQIISLTCRFQEKSFLKFLLSKETELDSFRQARPVRYSYAVDRQKNLPEPPASRS
jgi:hypothetical protein